MTPEADRVLERVRRQAPLEWAALEDFLSRAPEMARRADEVGHMDASAWAGLRCGVLNRLNVPPAFGGSLVTATALRRVTVFEQVGRICPGLPIGMPGPGLSTPPVMSLGTESQKQAYFGRFDTARAVWGAFAITESRGGSDAAAMRTTATRTVGGDYVLRGEKCFITSGALADSVVVFATLDPAKGRFGVRAFLVDRGTPGFRVERCEDMMGLRASQLASLRFDDCHVPPERMLGYNGVRGPLVDALTGAQAAWDFMRPGLSAVMNGACLGMLDHAAGMLVSGEAMLSRKEAAAVGEGLRDLSARLDAARLLVLRVAWRYDKGVNVSGEASMVKAHSSSLSMQLASWLAGQFFRHAACKGDRFEKFCRDAKGFDILEGTGDMQRIMAARWLARGA